MAKKRLKKRDPMQLFSEKRDFTNKKRPKRDPKSCLGLLRDPGPPKRDPVSSIACHISTKNQTKARMKLACFKTK